MATWNSRGLRGSTLEEFINRTNETYLTNGLALIQKVPTPITPINIDKATRHITLAYFEQKSTVDYIGAVQGIPVCFDAKECATDMIIIENLRIGEYVVSEVSDGASSAYVLPADKTASVFEGAVTQVEMHNELRDTPKTGDDSNPALWLALLGISAAGAAVLGVVGFRKRRKEGAE